MPGNLVTSLKSVLTLKLPKFFYMLLLGLTAAACTSTAPSVQSSQVELIPVDASIASDSLAEATIAPFKAIMNQQMQTVIGQAQKRLEKTNVESHLGNFVVDAILSQARMVHSDHIDMAVIGNGGLRAPIPQGVVKVSTVYELMPFENTLYILELNGSQTMALFSYLADNQRTSVANSVVLLKDDQVHKLFINGAPFDPEGRYILAVSDYLAEGGGRMEFLKEAKVLERYPVKIRDLIIDQVKWLNNQGQMVDAHIEGRVKVISGS